MTICTVCHSQANRSSPSAENLSLSQSVSAICGSGTGGKDSGNTGTTSHLQTRGDSSRQTTCAVAKDIQLSSTAYSSNTNQGGTTTTTPITHQRQHIISLPLIFFIFLFLVTFFHSNCVFSIFLFFRIHFYYIKKKNWFSNLLKMSNLHPHLMPSHASSLSVFSIKHNSPEREQCSVISISRASLISYIVIVCVRNKRLDEDRGKEDFATRRKRRRRWERKKNWAISSWLYDSIWSEINAIFVVEHTHTLCDHILCEIITFRYFKLNLYPRNVGNV